MVVNTLLHSEHLCVSNLALCSDSLGMSSLLYRGSVSLTLSESFPKKGLSDAFPQETQTTGQR